MQIEENGNQLCCRFEPESSGTGNTNSDVPDGSYQCKVGRYRHDETKDGVPKITCFLRIIDGQYKGYTLFKDWVLSDAAFPYIKQDFETLGFDFTVDRFSYMVSRLDETEGMMFNVSKKTKLGRNGNEFAQIFLNSVYKPLDGQKNVRVNQVDKPETKHEDDYSDSGVDDIPF